ncbi:hypothetical protein MHU86_19035 [Fragilaria crotonensis]|nr:hypothetical protein MHU86_19035 [Fragilaria crotonensis]
MGRSHSISNANGATNDIEAAEPKMTTTTTRAITPFHLPPAPRRLPLASYERPIKKQRVSFDTNVAIIKNKTTMKSRNATLSRSRRLTPKTLQRQEGYHSNRLRKCFPMHFSIRNPTITREIVEPRSPSSYFKKTHVSLPCSRRRSPENSDDAILSGDERAFEQDLTDLNPPEIGGERDETVTAKWMTTIPKTQIHVWRRQRVYTRDARTCGFSSWYCFYGGLYDRRTVLSRVLPFYAWARYAFLPTPHQCGHTPRHSVLPGTPPSTTSGRTRGISVTSLPDENTPSTVTPSMALVTTTALVRCPSAIPESKMPLTPTSTTTFAKMSLL